MEVKNKRHKLRSMGPNPYGYMCYCIDCGKAFGNYKDPKTSPCKMKAEENVIHFEKDEYPGGFQVESLCGVKAVFHSGGDCMVTPKDMRDHLTYGKLSVEEIITCSKCRELYLENVI